MARRGLYWAGVLACLVALVAGGIVAYLGYTASDGPKGAVTRYYAALSRGDAAEALALGDLPDGPHALLTADVLREQQRIAPLGHLQVVAIDQRGATARVTVRYTLGFAAGAQQVTDTVGVREHGGDWRLTRSAVPTALHLDGAVQRATILGGGVPDGAVLMFPGAVPVRFDTPYLQLLARSADVVFDSSGETDVGVEVSAAGRAAIARQLTAKLTACVSPGTAAPDPRCPVPNAQVVPGSLRGRITGNVAAAMDVSLDATAPGVIVVRGQVRFTGSYRQLDFDNVASAHTGDLLLPLASTAYATQPLALRWTAAT